MLKGSGSLIGQPAAVPAINTTGNPGMASAGMGDVLSGIIAALLGQGLAPFEAARSACLSMACAPSSFAWSRIKAESIASDIISLIPAVIKQLRAAG